MWICLVYLNVTYNGNDCVQLLLQKLFKIELLQGNQHSTWILEVAGFTVMNTEGLTATCAAAFGLPVS